MSQSVEISKAEAERIGALFYDEVTPILGQHSFLFVGSLRRLKETVHDIDALINPTDDRAIQILREAFARHGKVQILKWGPKIAQVIFYGISIDLYFSTPETFATLLLIRTGSVKNNIRLCRIAKQKGWKLHASGDGLFNEKGERIAGDTEKSIFDALGIPFEEAWNRG